MENKQNGRLDPKVYTMAASLFGVAKANVQDQVISLLQLPDLRGRLLAVFPALTAEAFAMTMDNFRIYVSCYNHKTVAENEQLPRYNGEVARYRKETALTEVQARFSDQFLITNKRCGNREWNEKAEAFNQEYGMLVQKRKVQTIKPQAELVFQNMLHLYNKQLTRRNNEYMRLSIFTPRPIQEFRINPYHITELKRNEVQSLDLCTKTIRNHRERMQEAGILTGYHFSGARRCVEIHINPEILAVFDIKTGKIVGAENQRVSPDSGKKLPDNNESTRTIIKDKCEIKENVGDNSPDKEFPAVTPCSFVFYRNTTSKEQNPELGPPPPGVKIFENFIPPVSLTSRSARPATPQQLMPAILPAIDPQTETKTRPKSESERLASMIIHPQALAIGLANREFDGYIPIDIRILFREAFSGTLTNEEFRQLVIQDFFMSSAKLFRRIDPWPAVWKNAINLYLKHQFISFTGNAFNKSVIIDDIEQLRWRLDHVRRYQARNPDWNILFPSYYFDYTRTSAKEGGFEYTKKAWAKHRKYELDCIAKKKRIELQAELRKKTINHAKKCETMIRKFFRNQVTMDQLLDYVHYNLPSQFSEKLPEMIAKISTKFK